ncbi:MAG: hypothetical protein R3F54_25985 [Alphaproteobacteria bacterium]
MASMLCLLPTVLSAGELGDFHRQVADAYAPYRSAMFYLRTGNPGVASLELGAAAKQWQAVAERFGDQTPDAFSEDPAFADSLTAISKAFEDGAAALQKEDAEAATEALEPIRSELAALRRRNGLRTFSDCIDDMNAAMDRLWVLRDAPPDFDDPAAVNQAKRAAAVTLFLYQRCHDQASDQQKAEEEFQRLFDGSLASLPLVFEALDQKNEGLLVNLLRELRSFDRMIWLQFG